MMYKSCLPWLFLERANIRVARCLEHKIHVNYQNPGLSLVVASTIRVKIAKRLSQDLPVLCCQLLLLVWHHR